MRTELNPADMKVFGVLAVVAAALAADWEVFSKTGMTINIGIGFRRDTPTEGKKTCLQGFWRS